MDLSTLWFQFQEKFGFYSYIMYFLLSEIKNASVVANKEYQYSKVVSFVVNAYLCFFMWWNILTQIQGLKNWKSVCTFFRVRWRTFLNTLTLLFRACRICVRAGVYAVHECYSRVMKQGVIPEALQVIWKHRFSTNCA